MNLIKIKKQINSKILFIFRLFNPFRIYRKIKYSLACNINKPFVGKMPGIKMKMIIRPNMHFAEAYCGLHKFEIGTVKFLRKIIRKDMVIMDIGANIGYFSLFFAKTIGKNGKVYAFEPTEYAYNLLNTNVKINNLEKIISTYKMAISDNNIDSMFFEYPEGYDTLSSLQPVEWIENKGIPSKKIKVQTNTIDSFIKKNSINNIDFIKVDVEGNELKVFKGMADYLDKNKNVRILFEFGERYDSFDYELKDITSYLYSFGFNFLLLENVKGRLIPLDNNIDVLNIKSNMIYAKKD